MVSHFSPFGDLVMGIVFSMMFMAIANMPRRMSGWFALAVLLIPLVLDWIANG